MIEIADEETIELIRNYAAALGTDSTSAVKFAVSVAFLRKLVVYDEDDLADGSAEAPSVETGSGNRRIQ